MKLSERVFSYFSCLEDFKPYKPKIFYGRTPRPPPPPSTTHLRYQNYHVIRVFVYRGFQLYRKPFPIENKLECKYCLESRFIPYFCRRERGKEQTKPSAFFLAYQKFPDSWTPPPPDENSWIRACLT